MFLALRELRRAPWRFGLLAAAVGLLVYLVLFMQAILGSLTGAITGAIEHVDADVLVYSDTARGQLDASVLDPALVDEVSAADGVGAAAAWSVRSYSAMAAASDLVDVAVFGHDPDGPGAPTTLVAGERPAGPDQAIASAADAGDGFDVGDRVVIEPVGREVEVVGIADDLNYSVQPTLFVDLETFEALAAERTAGAPFVPINAVAVAVEDGMAAADVVATLDDALDGVEVLTRDDAVAGIPGIDAIEQSFALILGLAFAVIGLVTGIFFLILTVQKRQPLTLLRAIGAAPRDVVVPLLVQVLLLTGGGVVIGVGLLVASAGVVPGELGIELQPGLVAATGAGIVVLGLLAALAAVRRVLRIDPAAALDTERNGGVAVKLALRELRRMPGRFFAVGTALMVIAVLVLVLGAILDGLIRGSTGVLRAQSGPLLVYDDEARQTLLRSRIDADLAAQIAGVDGVAEVRGLGVTNVTVDPPGETTSDDGLLGIVVVGAEGENRRLAPPGRGEAIADARILDEGYEVGDVVTLPGDVEVEIAATVRDATTNLAPSLWVDLDTWREVTVAARPDAGLGEGVVQALNVVVEDGRDPLEVAAAIDDATGTTETLDQQAAIAALPGVSSQQTVFAAIIAATLVVAALVVALFFVLLTLERQGLYAVLKAIGASTGRLLAGLVVQAVVVAAGAAAGAAVLTVALLAVLPDAIPVELRAGRVSVALAGLLLMSALGSVFSLRRLVRVDPADAIG